MENALSHMSTGVAREKPKTERKPPDVETKARNDAERVEIEADARAKAEAVALNAEAVAQPKVEIRPEVDGEEFLVQLTPAQRLMVEQQKQSLNAQQRALLGNLQQQFHQQQAAQKQQHEAQQQELVQQQTFRQQQFQLQMQQYSQHFMQQQGQDTTPAQQQALLHQLQLQLQQNTNNLVVQLQQQQQQLYFQQQQQLQQIAQQQQEQLAYHTQQLKKQEETLIKQLITQLLDSKQASASQGYRDLSGCIEAARGGYTYYNGCQGPQAPASTLANCTVSDFETQRRLKSLLNKAEEDLMQQHLLMQTGQAQFAKKQQELEARKKLEEMKAATQKWQINYSEIEFDKKIGEGSFGEVLKSKWRGSVVAVKKLKIGGDGLNITEAEKEKFSKEATLLCSLHHPNLVLFLGACLNPHLCMVTEFMLGGSLHDLLYKRKKIPKAQKRQVLSLDIARAMAYLHNSRPAIIHRNLKSINILLDDKGEHAKVCDVGLTGFKETCQSITGVVGTSPWMPPEIMKGQSYTEKADVYSFGLVLYEMVSGKIPFSNLPPEQIMLHVTIHDERPQLPWSCAQKWKDLISTCWATDTNKRPAFLEIVNLLCFINK